MHTRRIAAFLLGGWICGTLLIGTIQIQTLGLPDLVVNTPTPPAAKMIQTLGREQVGLLLRHFAAEQIRRFSPRWEQIQIALGLALGVCLLRATQARILPVALCAVMVALELFEYLALTPELTYLGREADSRTNVTAAGSMGALQVVYVGVEMVKVIAGGVLAGYLFVFRTPRRSRKEADALEDPAHL